MFFLLNIIISHSLLLSKELKSISLEEVLSIGDLNDDILYMWAGVTVDEKNNIYVTDTMDYSIKKFNSEGLLIKKAGRKGQGPGEFQAPRYIKYYKGLLFVTDQYIPGIQVFDKGLNYESKISFKMAIFDLKIISDKKIVILSPVISNPERIVTIDFKGNSKDDIKYLDNWENYWENYRKFEIDNQGNIYMVFTVKDKIKKFDKNMKELWTKSLFGKKKVKMKKSKATFGPSNLPTEVVYKDIELDIRGNLFILGGNFSKNPGKDVYVLNPNGNYLTTITLPESTHCIHIDRNNFLYSRSGMGTVLKKYFIKYIYK